MFFKIPSWIKLWSGQLVYFCGNVICLLWTLQWSLVYFLKRRIYSIANVIWIAVCALLRKLYQLLARIIKIWKPLTKTKHLTNYFTLSSVNIKRYHLATFILLFLLTLQVHKCASISDIQTSKTICVQNWLRMQKETKSKRLCLYFKSMITIVNDPDTIW